MGPASLSSAFRRSQGWSQGSGRCSACGIQKGHKLSYAFLFFHDEFDSLIEKAAKEGIRIVHLGRRDRLPLPILSRLDKAIAKTKDNKGMTLQLAIDYGGEDEIERCMAKAISAGMKEISYSTLLSYVDNPDIPAPDFICRSSGEKRLSGFLMLQASYAEIGFYDKLWPDWNESMIDTIIEDFNKRNRRFGGI